VQSPVPSAILGISDRHIGECGVKRLSHPLRHAVRDAKLGADVLKADAATPGGSHLGETEQILSLGKRNLTSIS